MKRSTKVGLGAGIAAAAAAAAAGAYFLYGKDGAKNRKKVKSWMVKARADVMQKMEKMEHVSQKRYHELVDAALKGYKNMKEVSPAELAAAAKELKGHWNAIQKTVRSTMKPKKAARKPARRTKKRRA